MGILTSLWERALWEKVRITKAAQPEGRQDTGRVIDPNPTDPDAIKNALIGGEQVETEEAGLLKVDPLMAYKIGAYYYACVEAVMNALTPVPFMVKDKAGEVTDKHEFLNSFLKTPGMLDGEPVTWARMFKRHIQNRYIFGGSRFQMLKEENSPGQYPIATHVLKRPDEMKFDAEKQIWTYTAGSEPKEFEKDEIKTLAMESPEGDTDMHSPIESMPASFNMLIGAAKFNKALFEHRTVVGGVLSFPHTLRTAVYKRLRANLTALAEGKAGKWLILEGIEGKSVDPRGSFGGKESIDGAYKDLRKDIKAEILAVTGVTPIMVGENESQTYHNASLQWKTFWQMTGQAILNDLTEFFNVTILGAMDPEVIDGHTLAYDEDYIKAMWQDIEQKHKQLDNQLSGGVITPNEYREAIGFEKIDDPAMYQYYMKGIPITFGASGTLLPAISDDGSPAQAQSGEGTTE